MAYENISVNSLRNAISACKNSLNCSGSSEIINSISENVLYSNNRLRIKDALSNIVDDHKKIIAFLDNYNRVVNKIEKYQELQNANASLDTKYSDLEGRLWKNEVYNEQVYNPETEEYETKESVRRVKDTYVEAEMSTNRNTKNANIEKMKELYNEIENTIRM